MRAPPGLLPPLVMASWLASAGCDSPPADDGVDPLAMAPPRTSAVAGPALQQGARRPNIIVIDIDSWRADRVLAERDGQLVAPTIAGLAHKGARFTQMVSQTGWTLTSVNSLLRGRYPPIVHLSGGQWSTRWNWSEGLLSVLPLYGYHTVGVWGETLAGSDPTLKASFETSLDQPFADEERWFGTVRRFLESQPAEPFFLLVHAIDLHPAGPVLEERCTHRYEPRRSDEPVQTGQQNLDWIQPLVRNPSDLGPLGAHMAAHYDATLSCYDEAVAAMEQALARAGLEQRTVRILTSDHGEAFYEHGQFGHGPLHYDTVLRVPLLWVDPELPQAGTVVDTPVETVDISASILARAGIPQQAEMVGRSLLPLLGWGDPAGFEPRPAFSLTTGEGASLRTDRYAMAIHMGWCRNRTGESFPGLSPQACAELFDLEEDPDERRDLVLERPRVTAIMQERLLGLVGEQIELLGEQGGKPAEELLSEIRQRGYWEVVQPPGQLPMTGPQGRTPGSPDAIPPGAPQPGRPGSPMGVPGPPPPGALVPAGGQSPTAPPPGVPADLPPADGAIGPPLPAGGR